MIGFLIVGFLITLFSKELPNAEKIRNIELQIPLRVYSADKLLISEFGNERRKPIPYNETPQILIDAVIASEDDGFFEHGGIDIKGLIRAAISNAQSGRSGQGASTITMQVARNFFLTPEKTYTRKIKEVLVAIRLEQILSKEEILSLYLNKIFLGHRSYGFGAAAEVYYGKPLNELDAAQVAMLAGLPKAPSSYNPIRNPERAKTRRNYVLGRLHQLGKLNDEELALAIEMPITAKKHSSQSDLNAPHIAEMVRAFIIEQYGEEAYYQGLNVFTTIYSKQQNAAQTALRKGLQAYDRRHGFRGAIANINIDELNEYENDTAKTQELENILSQFPSSLEQLPAITLNSDKKRAELWNSEYGRVVLKLADIKWAKRHKTANLVGDTPKNVSDTLKAGDVVYIKPRQNNADTKNEAIIKPVQESEPSPEQWQLSQIPNIGGALISMNPQNGQIISLVGGYDFFLNRYNRAIQSIRQPGSNIKPFIYSAALDKGFSPSSMISGAPIVITDPAHGTLWRPENYSGKFYGLTRMREALAKSMNLVSIRILRAIGVPAAREYASRFGLDMSRFSPTLTMALGSGGATPLEVLGAYSALANGGYKIEPYFIEKITDRHGDVLFQAPQPISCDECYEQFLPKQNIEQIEGDEANNENQNQSNSLETEKKEVATEQNNDGLNNKELAHYSAPRIMSHANNFLTVDMMKDVITRGTAKRARSLNRSDLAGKTGTTNDYVDAWFTGFNSQVATTVWVGFDQPSTMGRGESGSLTALPIWVDYMKTGLEGIAEDSSTLPEYIEKVRVNRSTGEETDELDPLGIDELKVIIELTPESAFNRPLDASLENDDFPDSTNDPNSFEEIESSNDLEPQERIIEDSQETEGLF